MSGKKTFNHRLAKMGWGALLIWWGVSIMIDPITIGMSAIGTGLILLGVNAIRLLKGIPTRVNTTVVGIMAIVWGVLDQARFMLSLSIGVSVALLLIVFGLAELLTPLLVRPKIQAEEGSGDV